MIQWGCFCLSYVVNMTFDYGKWRKKETTSKLYYLIPDETVRPNAKDTKEKNDIKRPSWRFDFFRLSDLEYKIWRHRFRIQQDHSTTRLDFYNKSSAIISSLDLRINWQISIILSRLDLPSSMLRATDHFPPKMTRRIFWKFMRLIRRFNQGSLTEETKKILQLIGTMFNTNSGPWSMVLDPRIESKRAW